MTTLVWWGTYRSKRLDGKVDVLHVATAPIAVAGTGAGVGDLDLDWASNADSGCEWPAAQPLVITLHLHAAPAAIQISQSEAAANSRSSSSLPPQQPLPARQQVSAFQCIHSKLQVVDYGEGQACVQAGQQVTKAQFWCTKSWLQVVVCSRMVRRPASKP
jgi:hypothetical protein